MSVNTGLATAATDALSTAYSVATLTTLPDECFLGYLHGDLDTIAGGATSVTVYLAADAAGDFALSDANATTIVLGLGAATNGGVNVAIAIDYKTATKAAAGTIYAVAKTNAGTCNAVWSLTFREDN